jgi:putative cell division membrane protein
MWIGAALIIAFLVLLADARFYYVFAYPIYLTTMFVLVLTLVFGSEVHGSRSWLAFGALRVQPSEFAKFATALTVAKLMGRFDFRIASLRSWVQLAGIVSVPIVLILLQNDMGSALVYTSFVLVFYREGMSGSVLLMILAFALVFLLELLLDRVYILFGITLMGIVLYVALHRDVKNGVRILGVLAIVTTLFYLANEWFVLNVSFYMVCLLPFLLLWLSLMVYGLVRRLRRVVSLSLFVGMCLAVSVSTDYVFNHLLDDHHRNRINDLLGIEHDPLGAGYNVHQSKIAIGSGGILGKGYLQGTQTKFNFVPEQSTDFIFCTVGEEWGFVGTCTVLFLFGAFLYRILKLAERQKEDFHRIYGYGVASIIFFHVVVNIAMTIGLFPVIGIPLPFFSYGGSSLWAFTILLFILVKFDSSRLR